MPGGSNPEVSLRIDGARKLADIAARLRAAGAEGKKLRREMLKNIRAAVIPLGEKVRQAEAEEWPRRGGFAERASSNKVTVTVRTGTTSTVRLRQRGVTVKSMRALDSGTLDHPVYGNREAWVSQQIKAGVWSDTLENEGSVETIRAAVVEAIDKTIEEISR